MLKVASILVTSALAIGPGSVSDLASIVNGGLLGNLNHPGPFVDVAMTNDPAKMPPIVYFSGLTASTITVEIKDVPLCNNTQPGKPDIIWPVSANMDVNVLCLLECFQVLYDDATGLYYDLPGVTPDSLDFGLMDGLSYGPALIEPLKSMGWIEGENLFGAPFDWRRSDQGLAVTYYPQVQALIEDAVNKTGMKASLIAPSYGPQVVLGFLQRMTQEWKDAYIDWFVAESPVWSGTVLPFGMLISGYPLPAPFTSIIRTLLFNMPSIYYLFPEPGTSEFEYSKDDVLVSTPNKNYTAWDIPTLLHDLGLDVKIPMYRDLLQNSSLGAFTAPGVNTFVTYGTEINTVGSFEFAKDFTHNAFDVPQPSSHTPSAEQGDGIVPKRSSMRAMQWETAQTAAGKRLLHREYVNQSHANCLFPANASLACFLDVFSVITTGVLPPLPPLVAAYQGY